MCISISVLWLHNFSKHLHLYASAIAFMYKIYIHLIPTTLIKRTLISYFNLYCLYVCNDFYYIKFISHETSMYSCDSGLIRDNLAAIFKEYF